MPSSRIIITLLSLIAIGTILVQCVDGGSGGDPRGTSYAGSAACTKCHREVALQYLHSNHYQTSAPVDQAALTQNINDSNNSFHFADGAVVSVREYQRSLVQQLEMNGQVLKTVAMDVAIGSGDKAKTFGYWKSSEELFQLPLTYLSSINRWTNSPGYPVQQAYFDRVIESRCLECHATYIDKTTAPAGSLQVKEKLDQQSLLFGIDCERCHGPAAAHVDFQEQHPGSKEAGNIARLSTLPRERKLDLCGVCHSGNELAVQRTLFAYRPGDTLSNFFFPHFGSGTAKPDVHGKQLQLLQMSKCYQQSEMTCGNCHSIHAPAKPAASFYISKCMDCHRTSAHATAMLTAKQDCIDCHMPLQVSRSLDFNDRTEARKIPYRLHSHRIAIYDSTAR